MRRPSITTHSSACGRLASISQSRITGKERDSETGLDYFGARYYGSNMGRWMSPDWSAKADPVPYAKLGDPQSLNLYAYVRNSPIEHVDVDGHYAVPGSDGCSDGRGGLAPMCQSAPKENKPPKSEAINKEVANTLIDAYNLLESLSNGKNARLVPRMKGKDAAEPSKFQGARY